MTPCTCDPCHWQDNLTLDPATIMQLIFAGTCPKCYGAVTAPKETA